MMHISIERLQELLPDDWEQRAKTARADVQNPPQGRTRADVFRANQQLWSELKSALRKLSYGKCWYCESDESRSDNAVDHYRPKSRVHEAQGHEGYWWLAFEPANYRYSCMFCNSKRTDVEGITGGKGDHFPLFDEAKRAFAQGGEVHEVPLLLDPTIMAHVAALWFEDNGRVAAADTEPALIPKQVEASTLRYHLDHPDLVQRRAIRCRDVRILAEEADKEMKDFGLGTAQSTAALNRALRQIKVLMAPEAEYSAAVRCTLLSMSGNSYVARAALRA